MAGPADHALILVVEDDLAVSRLISDVLEEDLGVEVAMAADGARGLDLARRLQPDLVLLDVDLPKMNGLAVARRLKADPTTWAIPLMAVTSGSRVETMAAGCDDHLDKPFDLDELVSRVVAHLTPNRSRERAA